MMNEGTNQQTTQPTNQSIKHSTNQPTTKQTCKVYPKSCNAGFLINFDWQDASWTNCQAYPPQPPATPWQHTPVKYKCQPTSEANNQSTKQSVNQATTQAVTRNNKQPSNPASTNKQQPDHSSCLKHQPVPQQAHTQPNHNNQASAETTPASTQSE
jgi:hypothetical protein